jgi:hypothetical protein
LLVCHLPEPKERSWLLGSKILDLEGAQNSHKGTSEWWPSNWVCIMARDYCLSQSMACYLRV